jgi:16S rRNA (guanine1207-N2)-methyltransferase
MDDYYTYRTLTVELREQAVKVVTKPGLPNWEGLDPGTRLLAEAMEIGPEDRVLDLGCGPGAVGVVAAWLAHQGHVTLVDSNCVAVEAARHTLAANGIENASVVLSDGTEALPPDARFDVVTLHLPKGKAVIEQFIHQAADALVPGGHLYLAGPKQGGLKGAVALVRQVFGAAGVIGMKKAHHVVVAQRTDDRRQTTDDSPSSVVRRPSSVVELLGRKLQVYARPGVFAWEGVDDGTRALMETMQVQASDTALDLGCGAGLIGLSAALRAPAGHVYLVDADVRAVESARQTLAANGVTNATVLISDCASAVYDVQFDVVATNPPFHQGVGTDYEVALQFVRDAARVLKPGGRLYLVANRFLKYEAHILEHFDGMKVAWQDNRYKVLTAWTKAKRRAKSTSKTSH